MINTMLKAKLIERGIPELDPIVTASSFQADGMLIVQPQSQALKVSIWSNTSSLLSRKNTQE
jgi:hypothetical protein